MTHPNAHAAISSPSELTKETRAIIADGMALGAVIDAGRLAPVFTKQVEQAVIHGSDPLDMAKPFGTMFGLAVSMLERLAQKLIALRNDLLEDPDVDERRLAEVALATLSAGLEMIGACAAGHNVLAARQIARFAAEQTSQVVTELAPRLALVDKAVSALRAAGVDAEPVEDKLIKVPGGTLQLITRDTHEGVIIHWEPIQRNFGGDGHIAILAAALNGAGE